MSETTSAGAASQSVDFCFVDALYSPAFVLCCSTHFENADSFVGGNSSRFCVTFRLCASSAARTTSVFTLLLGWRVIPFTLLTKDDTIFCRHFLTFSFGSQALVSLHAVTFTAFGIKRICPTGAYWMRNAIDDTLICLFNVLANGNFAAASIHDLTRYLAFTTGFRGHCGARLCLTFQEETATLIGLVDNVFTWATFGHFRFFAQLVHTLGERASARICLRDKVFTDRIATDWCLCWAKFPFALIRFATTRACHFLDCFTS